MIRRVLVIYVALLSLFAVSVIRAELITTTPTIDQVCSSLNASCQDCVADKRCFWCESPSQSCLHYPSQDVFPPSSVCHLSDSKFITCSVNLGIVIIVCGVLLGLIVITVTVCICCCCGCCDCKNRLSRRELREDRADEAEAESRRARTAERRAERQSRWDEIRQKYGLSTNSSGGSYSRFSNDAAEA